MALHMENQKQCSSKNGNIHSDLLEKLKLEEEREKKKLEKEAKRRAELEKFKNESLERQASLLVPVKKEKQSGQSKPLGLKTQSKKSANKKQQSQNSQRTNQSSLSQAKVLTSTALSNASVTQQPYHERVRHYSTSSESSWKRDGYGKSRSSSRSDSMWGDVNNHFPVLGVDAPPPQTNVWVERKIKQEENKALEPQSQYDEEAMLQRALALSMMEASKEQERQRKFEEECQLQTATLESNPRILEELNMSEELIAPEEPDHKYQSNLKLGENYPENSFSTNRALPSFNQKNNSSSIGGARPKLSKVIDSFGGWGLKTASKDKYANKLSNYVDEIVNEEPSKETNNYSSRYQQNTFKNNVKRSEIDDPWDVSDAEVEKSVITDLWPYNKDAENSSSVLDPWRREVLYDEKGTFTDVDDAKHCDFSSSVSDYNNVPPAVQNPESLDEESPSSKLDKWLDAVDESATVSNGWDEEDAQDEKISNDISLEAKERYLKDRVGSFSSTHHETKFEDSKISLAGLDTFDSAQKDISDSCSHNNFHTSSKTTESFKDTLSDMERSRKQTEFSEKSVFTQFKNTYDYIIGSDTKINNESNSVKTFQNEDVFSDKSSDKSTSSPTNHPKPTETSLIQSDGSERLGAIITNKDNVPPILPPQPASAELVTSIKSQAEIPINQDTENPALNMPPKAPVEMPLQFSPMLNPMFPAINPMLGLGLDPITMRQMLMLSNPFFASQLLAMEQYYRSLGMPVDLFSFPAQTVPNMPFPGFMGAPISQNIFPNVANFGAPASQDPKLQTQPPDQSVPQPDNQMNDSSEKTSSKFQTPFEEKGDNNHVPKPFYSEEEEDSWYSSLLTNDNASVIPPPKPPSLNTNTSCSSLTSDVSKLSQSASDFNSSERNHCVSASLESAHGKVQTPLLAAEACKNQTEDIGWGDIVADSSKQSKASDGWDDDGWGDNLPAKSVKSSTVYEEKRKVVPRQPARQPQLSRFQSNRRYN